MTTDDTPICSAKGCRAAAIWVLAWNNPKLHTPDRRKTWLACEEHREHLSDFLGMRGFLKDVVALTEWHDPAAGTAESQPDTGGRDSGDRDSGDRDTGDRDSGANGRSGAEG